MWVRVRASQQCPSQWTTMAAPSMNWLRISSTHPFTTATRLLPPLLRPQQICWAPGGTSSTLAYKDQPGLAETACVRVQVSARARAIASTVHKCVYSYYIASIFLDLILQGYPSFRWTEDIISPTILDSSIFDILIQLLAQSIWSNECSQAGCRQCHCAQSLTHCSSCKVISVQFLCFRVYCSKDAQLFKHFGRQACAEKQVIFGLSMKSARISLIFFYIL